MKFERDKKKQEVYTDFERDDPVPNEDYNSSVRRTALDLNLHMAAGMKFQNDTDFYQVVCDFVAYLSSTYEDKYEDGRVNPARELMLDSPNSDITIWNALKYIQRYQSVGYEKSGDTKDLKKAIHYLLFELQRRK